jgi:hypothetical protein
MYSYPNEYGPDTDEDNTEEEYFDEETRIDRILERYESLQTERQLEQKTFEQIKEALDMLYLDAKVISRDIVKYIIHPFLDVSSFPEIPGLTEVEILPDINTPQLEEYFQPYDLPPCEIQRLWTEPNYNRYYNDNEVTEKREFYCKMLFVSLTGYSKRDWYKCRRYFYSSRKWWKRFYQVKELWYAFHLMLYPELKEDVWDRSFWSLKWTYTLNGIRQDKELMIKEITPDANLFLWFEIPEEVLRKGSVDVQLQLRKKCDSIVFESKTYHI